MYTSSETVRRQRCACIVSFLLFALMGGVMLFRKHTGEKNSRFDVFAFVASAVNLVFQLFVLKEREEEDWDEFWNEEDEKDLEAELRDFYEEEFEDEEDLPDPVWKDLNKKETEEKTEAKAEKEEK